MDIIERLEKVEISRNLLRTVSEISTPLMSTIVIPVLIDIAKNFG